MDDRLRDNLAWWEERVPLHVASEYYDVPGFLSGASTLRDFERAELADLSGARLVHPQCHLGLDTLSLARLGAEVTGLDFSPRAIAAARELARRADLPAEFVCADVHDASAALGGRRFDLVYTGLGALNWLPDVARWAEVMASLLRPGGRLYLAEFHPVTWVFSDHDLTLEHPYFGAETVFEDGDGSYADLAAATVHNRTVEWNHGLGAVVSSLVDAGLRIAFLHEHAYTLHARWPFLVRRGDGTYALPPGMPSLPLMYSLLATSSR